MLRRFFHTPRNEYFDDVESCPPTPMEEAAPPTVSPSGKCPPSFALSSAPTRAQSHRKRPALRQGGSELDYIRVIADEYSQVLFDVPRRHLPELLTVHQPETVTVHDRSHDGEVPVTGIFLRNVKWASFADFVAWTKTDRILQYPHNDKEWIIEHHARRLIDALALGVIIKSTDYQRAALAEFHILAPLLEWPEDFVNSLFAATGDHHPARQLIVAIVAAKTCGEGKRKVRQGPRDVNVERGDRISSWTFWKMFDAYCLKNGPECSYPEEGCYRLG